MTSSDWHQHCSNAKVKNRHKSIFLWCQRRWTSYRSAVLAVDFVVQSTYIYSGILKSFAACFMLVPVCTCHTACSKSVLVYAEHQLLVPGVRETYILGIVQPISQHSSQSASTPAALTPIISTQHKQLEHRIISAFKY